MNLLLPGMYIAADSPVHRLDPRVKLGAALGLMALPFAAPGLWSNLFLTAFVAAIAFLSMAPPLALLRTLRTMFWIGCFMFFFYLFTTPGRPLITLGSVATTWEGMWVGATQVYRLCLLIVVSALLSFTTSPAQLAHGIETLIGPLARLGLPVRDLAMVLTIALRFVPTLFDQVDKIAKTQQARGADIHSANPLRRMQSWRPLFVPIFVSAFRRADELATAMEARGFRGAQHRTHLYQLRLTRQDLAASLIVLGAGLAAIGLNGV